MKISFSFLAVYEEFIVAAICIIGVPTDVYKDLVRVCVCVYVTCYNMKNLKSK